MKRAARENGVDILTLQQKLSALKGGTPSFYAFECDLKNIEYNIDNDPDKRFVLLAKKLEEERGADYIESLININASALEKEESSPAVESSTEDQEGDNAIVSVVNRLREMLFSVTEEPSECRKRISISNIFIHDLKMKAVREMKIPFGQLLKVVRKVFNESLSDFVEEHRAAVANLFVGDQQYMQAMRPKGNSDRFSFSLTPESWSVIEELKNSIAPLASDQQFARGLFYFIVVQVQKELPRVRKKKG